MRKNNSIPFYKVQNCLVTLCQNALTLNLNAEDSAKYFIEEIREQFNMPELDFKFTSLRRLEGFLKKRFHKIHPHIKEELVRVHGMIFGQALVKCMGGFWLDNPNNDEPLVAFEDDEFNTINPISCARDYFYSNPKSPALVYYNMIIDRIDRGVYLIDKENLIPNYKEFNNLNPQLSYAMIMSVRFDREIAVRKTHSEIIYLLQIKDFYVEIFVCSESGEEWMYRYFQASNKSLNPYLTNIKIPTV